MAENTNPTTPAATAVDPMEAALREAGATTTDAKAIPTPTAATQPTAVDSDIKLITTDKPENGAALMRDQISPSNRAKAEGAAKQLKIDDGLQATQFGLKAQEKITHFSRDKLGEVTVADSGLIGLFEDFHREVDGLDVKGLGSAPKGSWFGWIGDLPWIGSRWRAFKRFLKARESLETKLVNMTSQFEAAKMAQIRTHEHCEELAKLNDEAIDQLQLAIAMGEFKEDALVAEFNEKAKSTPKGNIAEKTRVQRFLNLIMRFKARVHNLRKSLIASETTAPMIEMVDASALDQVAAIDDFLNLAIPEFRKQILIGLMLHNQQRVNQMLAAGRTAFDKSFANNTQLLGEVQKAVAENQRLGIGSTEVLQRAVADLGTLLSQRVEGIKLTLQTWSEDRVKLEGSRTQLANDLDKANAEVAAIELNPDAPVAPATK